MPDAEVHKGGGQRALLIKPDHLSLSDITTQLITFPLPQIYFSVFHQELTLP